MNSNSITKLIQDALPGSKVEVYTNDNIHFKATVSYSGFKGKSRVAQHRMVYTPLEENFSTTLHALQLTTIVEGDKHE